MTSESSELSELSELPEEGPTGSLGLIVFDEDDDLFSFDELSSPVAHEEPLEETLPPSVEPGAIELGADELEAYEPVAPVAYGADDLKADEPGAYEYEAEAYEPEASVEEDLPELKAILTDLDAALPDVELTQPELEALPLAPDTQAPSDEPLFEQIGAPGEEWAAEEMAYEYPEEPPARPQIGSLLRTGALVAALTACNLTLVGIVLRSQRAVEQKLDGVDERLSSTVAELRRETAESVSDLVAWRQPTVSSEQEGLEAIEIAADEIAAGRYARARTRLYSLLAVVDRLDPAVRTDLEARASFWIGEAWRSEADALVEDEG